jgi:hypothetical protein
MMAAIEVYGRDQVVQLTWGDLFKFLELVKVFLQSKGRGLDLGHASTLNGDKAALTVSWSISSTV